MENQQQYFKEYFVNSKFIGYKNFVEKDRDYLGFKGEKKYILENDVFLENKRKIKKGIEVQTYLQLLSVKK